MMLTCWEATYHKQTPPFCDYYAPTNIARRVDSADVAAFGKSSGWGDFRIEFWLRTRRGDVLQVNASKQEPDAKRWLYKLSKQLKTPIPGREQWLWNWLELPPAQ